MKIFWSWQSDTEGNTGRHFVRKVIKDAIDNLREAEDIEEAFRENAKKEIHIDHDRQGVSGSPPLVETIQQKIRESTVFIADITPVSTIPKKDDSEKSTEKRCMNPNVAMELGYAWCALTATKLIMVLNEYYGGRKFIPFDLQHLSGPITYNLAPDASKAEIAGQHKKLKEQIVTALRPYLNATSNATNITFPLQPSTTSHAVWFGEQETIAESGSSGDGDLQEFYFESDRGIYLRISPQNPLPAPLTIGQLHAKTENFKLGILHRNQFSSIKSNNDRGVAFFEPRGHRGPLIAATQIFCSGEIWAFTNGLLVQNDFGDNIPVIALETYLRSAIQININFLRDHLKIDEPYRVEFGAHGVAKFSLAISTNFDLNYKIRDDDYQQEFILKKVSDGLITDLVKRYVDGLYTLTGYKRPT